MSLDMTEEESAKDETPPIFIELIFDKPFLLYIKKKDAPLPYLAIWIGNTELLEPTD